MSSKLKLSELLEQVNQALREKVPKSVWVKAEILEINENRSGHCYLELVEKDEEKAHITARCRATIWASKYGILRPYFQSSTGTSLKSGIKILLKGSVEFHPVYGFSINISDIDPSYTLGDLERRKQEVISRLNREGIMDMNKELAFPLVPLDIAVISSESAAGYGDFMDSLKNNPRGFQISTCLYPALMQGDEAPGSIMAALDSVHSSGRVHDCVVLIRGGGSKADLECYNNYELAYYITQFPQPVVTGIGHERDQSVADLVASAALKTPTAVAEFLLERLLSFEFLLSSYSEKLASAAAGILRDHSFRLERLETGLTHSSGGLLQSRSEEALQIERRLATGIKQLMERKEEQLSHLEKRMELMDPQNILNRGYSMSLIEGKSVTEIGQLKKGMILETRLKKGRAFSKIEKTES